MHHKQEKRRKLQYCGNVFSSLNRRKEMSCSICLILLSSTNGFSLSYDSIQKLQRRYSFWILQFHGIQLEFGNMLSGSSVKATKTSLLNIDTRCCGATYIYSEQNYNVSNSGMRSEMPGYGLALRVRWIQKSANIESISSL